MSKVYAAGRIVGEVTEDGRFVKRVRGSVHMLREPKGWALDIESLGDAESLGAHTVEIFDTESNVSYTAPIDRIRSKGFRFNRGFGAQIALPLQFWTVRRTGEPEQLAFALEGVR